MSRKSTEQEPIVTAGRIDPLEKLRESFRGPVVDSLCKKTRAKTKERDRKTAQTVKEDTPEQ